MRQKIHSITQFIKLPAICSLCHQFHKEARALCKDCIALIEPLDSTCHRCAEPLPDNSLPLCGSCIQNPPYFDRALIPYPFEEPLRSLLHHFKYRKKLYLAPVISEFMGLCYPLIELKPQCLIPIPLHPKRLRARGFNQAAMLTKLLAKQWDLPYSLNSCRKVINTIPQANLDAKKRHSNLVKAFQASPLPYQHVALVDDLLTTGSTANALARALKKVGVERVDIWCCARAVLKKM